MSYTENIRVSDTAFVTCGFRRINENLSHDCYAKLWHNEKAEFILKDYLSNVSNEEVETHCIRNRFFLETINTLIEKNKIDVLINFGAGFSMYPFLVNKDILHIEIDKPEVVNYKKNTIKKWVAEGELPQRDIHYLGVDFSDNYKDDLIKKVKKLKGKKSCFILIEGVLFFLNRSETHKIFNLFEDIQSKNDFIGSVSYTEDVKETQAYDRLIAYSNKGLKDASKEGFQTIKDSYYENLNSYKLIDKQDYFTCSKLYQNTPKLNPTDILNEHFYILQKS